jgi:Zn finger protein HypA/HybF involved in hydrogenase expression
MMIDRAERLIDDLLAGKVTRSAATKKLVHWWQTAYQSGLKVGINHTKGDWECLCEACGRSLFPNHEERKFEGATLHFGTCPKCGNEATMIPIDDWLYASGLSSGII